MELRRRLQLAIGQSIGFRGTSLNYRSCDRMWQFSLPDKVHAEHFVAKPRDAFPPLRVACRLQVVDIGSATQTDYEFVVRNGYVATVPHQSRKTARVSAFRSPFPRAPRGVGRARWP